MTRLGALGRRRAGLAVLLLAAGAVVWAAVPMAGATRGARPALIAAVLCVVLSLVQLASRVAAGRPGAEQRAAARSAYSSALEDAVLRVWYALTAVHWPEFAVVAVLVLEVLHPSRGWHTAVLGLVLVGYLLALHLAESNPGAGILRAQLPLLIAAAGLAVLSAGAGLLPTASAGPAWLSAIAAVAAVIAAGLALPV
jgi:hypothetical protein